MLRRLVIAGRSLVEVRQPTFAGASVLADAISPPQSISCKLLGARASPINTFRLDAINSRVFTGHSRVDLDGRAQL